MFLLVLENTYHCKWAKGRTFAHFASRRPFQLCDVVSEYRSVEQSISYICGRYNRRQNKSIPSAAMETRADFAEWMKDVFDSLGLETAHLAGLSLGGSHIVNFLLRAPERVERAVVISPAEAFISFHPDVYKYAAELTGARGAESYIKWITGDSYDLHPLLQRQIVAGVEWQDEQRSLKPTENGFPYVFTDQELKSIQVPVLLMFGEHEAMYHQQMAFERASVLVPGIQAEIVKNAGHLLSLEQPEYVNQRVLSFLCGGIK